MNQIVAATILALGLVVAAWLHATRSVVVTGPEAYVYEPRTSRLLFCDSHGDCYTVRSPQPMPA